MTEVTHSTNWPVIGHNWAVAQVVRSLKNDRVRHAYLITGPASIGKTTFAKAFAQAINCLSDTTRPCGVCRACQLIAHGTHADVRIIQAEGNTLKIEQIRDMQRQLSLRPVEARRRVIILRRFDQASTQAMDALLKTLEEPAPYVMLILTADTADTLLPTIKSRCQPLALRALPAPIIRRALEEHFKVEPEHAALLSQLSGGRIGWAIRAAGDESLLTERNELLDLLEKAITMPRFDRFAVAETLSKDKATVQTMLELWLTYWRDVLLLCYNATTPLTNRDRRHTIQQISVGVKGDDVERIITAIQRTALYVDQNVNVRLALEVLMLDFPRLKLFAAPPG